MSQVRIYTTIPVGDLDVTVPIHLMMADSGTAQLRDALLKASNRILLAYGEEEITIQQDTEVTIHE